MSVIINWKIFKCFIFKCFY